MIIDDTRAGSKTYNDLVLITKSLALPQIFIDEVLIGGYDEVSNVLYNNLPKLTYALHCVQPYYIKRIY